MMKQHTGQLMGKSDAHIRAGRELGAGAQIGAVSPVLMSGASRFRTAEGCDLHGIALRELCASDHCGVLEHIFAHPAMC